MLNEASNATNEKRILEQLPVGVLQVDSDMMLRYANHSAEALLGKSAALLFDKPITDVFRKEPDLLEVVQAAVGREGSFGAQDIRLGRLGHNIAKVFVRVSVDASGTMSITLSPKSEPRDADPTGETATMAEVARILGHEVKNPLAGMVGASQLLLRNAREDQQAMLTLIREEGSRITRIIDRFSAFETFFRPRPQLINIHEVLIPVIDLANASFATNVKIQQEFDPSLPEFSADPDHLHEAFLNLIKNACEAILNAEIENGTISIETRYRGGVRLLQESRSKQGAIEVRISDNGPGIPELEQKRVFSPFFSTKAAGAGIGLSVVAEIMSAHGGLIELESNEQGASFRLLLPLEVEG